MVIIKMNENEKINGEEKETQVTENNGDYSVSASKFQNVVAKILCVLAAVSLWFYVVSTDTAIEEKTFTAVPVSLRNIELAETQFGLSVIDGYNCTVDLILHGAKSDISRLSLEDVSAYVDAGGITASGEYFLEIETSLPVGVSVGGQSANYIQIYVDKRTSINVPVIVDPIYSMESTYSLGEPEPSFESVMVTGPAVELEKISYAVVSLDLGRINKTLTATGKLKLVDEAGTEIPGKYIKMHTSEVSVKIPVYTYKDVPLAVNYKYGYYNKTNVDIEIDPKIIRIKGEPERLDKINEIVIAEIDEKQIKDDGIQTVSIDLPDNIEFADTVSTANVHIKHKATETQDFDVTNLTVVNTNGLDYVLEESSINVTFRGTKALLSLLTNNNIKAVIDLDGYSEHAGLVTVPVKITVQNTLVGGVYEIGEYSINVTIY